jgi:hypothetical protein
VLELLLAADADDASARALWSLRWHEAAADASGRARPDAATLKLLAREDPWPARLVERRAAAAGELVARARAAEARGAKAPEELLVAWWARRTARELLRTLPAARAAAGELAPEFVVAESVWSTVLRALEQSLTSALASGDPAAAYELAACLNGLATQGGFDDLEGPRPKSLERVREAAAEGLARAGERLADDERPWTIEELEELDPEQAERFTREHASPARPGRALSPRGWYVVETFAGHETLLGVARTVERHHERLARWYGEDPFVGRAGLVRVVPEMSDLEAAGTPFWWAGGFQAGDTTVLRFACDTIEGFGHGLTHELTHRFDGALFPGQPAWLSEGKAVHTGAAFTSSYDQDFADDFANFGTLEAAWIKGYGGEEKLGQLIEGSLEDYRDNYVAGYALYVYLATWEVDGRALFEPNLRAFMRGAGAAKGERAFFVKCFADGADGRPKGLEEFARGFETFLSGFYWRDPKPWAQRYRASLEGGGGGGYVYDAPTWSSARVRAEPVFGQDQAFVAAELLAARGKEKEALAAALWALAADGRSPASEARLEQWLLAQKKAGPAWVLARERGAAGGAAPFESELGDVRAYEKALGEAAAFYAAAGATTAALALEAERARLGGWLGRPSEVRELAAAPAAPFDPAPRPVGALGWREDGLTDFEEHRVADLWYVDGADLHVGRAAPRTGTGRFERGSAWQHAFVRAEDWLLPGRYRVKARIHFTTSYASGAVVLGYTRRDQNLRFHFSAGDLMYAIEESEKEPSFEEVGWSLGGLRERDGHMASAAPRGTKKLDAPAPGFTLELLVDGATVEAFVNDDWVATYHTLDGAPIEGYLGFATGHGAVRVEAPSVERLDLSAAAGWSEPSVRGLDLARASATPFDSLENLPLRGVPHATNGTLVLWIPAPVVEAGGALDRAAFELEVRAAWEEFRALLERERVPQPLVLVVPRELDEDARARLRAEESSPSQVLAHALEAGGADEQKRWLLLVDGVGAVRWSGVLRRRQAEFPGPLRHWLAVLRDQGRPARELPAYSREK